MPNTNAIRAGRAFVELFADDSKLVRGLRRAEKKLKAFGARIGAMGRKLATLGAAAAAPLALSTKVFAGFDDQMRAVQAVLGATGKQFNCLNDKAQLLGRTTSYTAAQVVGAMLELARAGFDTGEIDKATNDVLALARATGTDLAEATNIAGNTLRSFGMAAGECLFLGASGSKRGSGEDWEITFRFAGSPNRSNITIGSITGIAKKGWEYLWVEYESEEDGSAKRIVKRPIAAYVEKVYEEGDFSVLGIET